MVRVRARTAFLIRSKLTAAEPNGASPIRVRVRVRVRVGVRVGVGGRVRVGVWARVWVWVWVGVGVGVTAAEPKGAKPIADEAG